MQSVLKTTTLFVENWEILECVLRGVNSPQRSSLQDMEMMSSASHSNRLMLDELNSCSNIIIATFSLKGNKGRQGGVAQSRVRDKWI